MPEKVFCVGFAGSAARAEAVVGPNRPNGSTSGRTKFIRAEVSGRMAEKRVVPESLPMTGPEEAASRL